MKVEKIEQAPELAPKNGQAETGRELLETVAHELHTPLHTASGFLSFLLQGMAGPVTAIQRDMLVSLGSSLQQAQSLVEDLSCLAQLEQGELPLNLELVALQPIVRETLSQFELVAEAAGVKLVGFNLAGNDFFIMTAPNRVSQCLRNLISNALKFSSEGGAVRVSLEETAESYTVRVEDQGPGIRPEHLALIFERHFQIKDPSTRHLGGYGLGLSITRDLIERLGGFVGVESSVGKGSCFFFSLPKAPARLRDQGAQARPRGNRPALNK
jgi:two-component system sensor histidine kinase BaeS